ncbi:prophage tail fiber N-terminal domain-containing protein, partial [Enterovibrio norvegicus]|uniref:prophage tail fiber N-terminal domain-containing protein n=1 Tax=Enterovibrio norvegicus TaxID=188144 RepID=UPI00037B86BF
MAVIISDILIGPNSAPLAGVTIKFIAAETSHFVIKTVVAETTTAADGAYSVTVPVGLYDVVLSSYGVRPQTVGQFRVYTDSESGTLNDFLNAPKTAPS